MNIDNIVEKYKDEIINNLADLVSYQSVAGEKKENAPFGEENAKCLNRALEIAKGYGFDTKNLDNYCGYAQIGNGEKIIGIAAHLDVVPAGDNWDTNPFKATLKDGKVYGRGTSDDKGAVVASMIALKIIKDLNIPLNKKIRLILGCAEETGSDCMKYYKEKEGEFEVGFTPDGDFPCLYGEKGHIRARYVASKTKIMDIVGGTVANAVSAECEVKVQENSYNKELLIKYFNDNNVGFDISNASGVDTILVKGIAAHASKPELGKDAIYYAITGLKYSEFEDCFVDFYCRRFNKENDGKGLNIDCKDEYGDLTCVNGKILMENGNIQGTIDARVPVTLKSSDVVSKLKSVFEENIEIIIDKYSETTFFDLNSKLVKMLLSVYQEVTGDLKSLPITVGGGTYAKSFSNCIAFGCKFQNKENNIHNANEFVDMDDLVLQVKLYVNAIIKLLEY